MSRFHRRSTFQDDIPSKANRVLNLILLGLILIGIRVWHLSVVQHDQRLEESRKPQRRVIVEPAKRASIRDRFNIPLAINKMQYQATIIYSQIQQVPSVVWEKDSTGKRVKVFKRKQYIGQLARLLGEELHLDPERLEDLIYAKAAFYANTPFVIKEEISEKEFYRLKMMEKDWLGIHVRQLPKRYYPLGRVGSDIIGYMGAINRNEYEAVLHEMKALQEYLSKKEEGEDPDLPKGVETEAQARKRLQLLQHKAYTIHDYVGKSGIEGRFEEELRGFQGQKSYFSDARGNFLRELPGSRDPLAGHRFLLTISSELQEYAEALLAQNEPIRQIRVTNIGLEKHTTISDRHPWIKGGSIVVMDPNNGEILALASYPRFNPNDFITSSDPLLQSAKQGNIGRWFETETHLADIWNQKQPLEREHWNSKDHLFYDETRYLTWDAYLDFIFPSENEVKIALQSFPQIQHAMRLQKGIDALISLAGQSDLYAILNAIYFDEGHAPHRSTLSPADKTTFENRLKEQSSAVDKIKKSLQPYFGQVVNNYNKVLLVDLCRVAVQADRFKPNLQSLVGDQTISFYHDVSCSLVSLKKVVEKMTKELYHDLVFKEWRKNNEKAFLKQKRDIEKAEKKYPTPYIDYIDKEEEAQFQAFWQQHHYTLLLALLSGKSVENADESLKPFLEHFFGWHHELSQGAHQAIEWRQHYDKLRMSVNKLSPEVAIEYLQTMRSYKELDRPLLGRYRFLRSGANQPLEKHLAAAFYPLYGFGYGRSHAYRQSTVQGSIFKMVVAYESLVQRFQMLGRANPSKSDLNPLNIVDKVYKEGSTRYLGFTHDGKPIPQNYNGGRLPRSQMSNIGPIDLVKALETSSNPYFALLASEHLDDPQDLVDAAYQFSYGQKTGIDLPGELTGKVPSDVHNNKTGLYAFAIGQHSLVVTPLQTTVMLAALANGGNVLKPKIVNQTAGRRQGWEEESIPCLLSFPYQEGLQTVGIDFPLFTSVLRREDKGLVTCIETQVKRRIFMPAIVRTILLEAMHLMAQRTQTQGLPGLKKIYAAHPEAIAAHREMKDQIIGKTSTSEVVERIDLDFDNGINIYTHVWFGGIAFECCDKFDKPELVIVVYLRYGGFGKEAAPLAGQIVKKWREIKQKHAVSQG